MAIKTFVTSAKSESPEKITFEARGLQMVVGRGEYLSPVEHLLGGLAGCINIMGHLIAKEMGFSLHGMEIAIEANMDTSKSSGEATQNRAGLLGIKVAVKPDTDADEETQKKWLATLEDRSPVRDVICNPTGIKLALSDQN